MILFFLTTFLAAESPWFTFSIPLQGSNGSVADWSFLNSIPAGKNGPVRLVNGQYRSGTQRIKWVGVNISILPEPAEAEAVAKHLARFGVNIVRFHHIDAPWHFGVFCQPGYERPCLSLDVQGLKRLDAFIEALKNQGIYTNMNLLTGRWLTSRDGLPVEIDTIEDFKIRHALGFWYRPILDLQKQYARDLLGRRSFSSGLNFNQDPALAIVEINNEAGLIHSWLSGHLDDLPEVFSAPLRQSWNSWILSKLGRDGWRRLAAGVRGPNAVTPSTRWSLEEHREARGTLRQGNPLRVDIRNGSSEGWHLQLVHGPLSVLKDGIYELKFSARVSSEIKISLGIFLSMPPWSSLGWTQEQEVGREWQDFRYLIRADTNEESARILISNLANSLPGWLELRDFSFQPIDPTQVTIGDPVNGGVPIPTLESSLFLSKGAYQLWWDFLIHTEEAYWREMVAFIKNDLGFRCPVIGTTTFTVSPHRALLWDAHDEHSYWQHPEFPGKAWDMGNWYIRNEAMIRNPNGGILSSLALRRVFGRAYTVSEYDHPSPNLYNADTYLSVASVGATQDWDGFYGFVYDAPNRISRLRGFFELSQHPLKWASLGPSASLFRRGDLAPWAQEKVYQFGPANDTDPQGWKSWQGPPLTERLGYNSSEFFQIRVGLDLEQSGLRPTRSAFTVTSTPENFSMASGILKIVTPRTSAVSGFIAGKEFSLGRLGLKISGNASGWGQVIFTETQPGWYVLIAGGVSRNQNTLNPLPQEGDHLFLPTWDTGPIEVERLGLEFGLQARDGMRIWALDGAGGRVAEVPFRTEGGRKIFSTGRYDTIWFEIQIP